MGGEGVEDGLLIDRFRIFPPSFGVPAGNKPSQFVKEHICANEATVYMHTNGVYLYSSQGLCRPSNSPKLS